MVSRGKVHLDMGPIQEVSRPEDTGDADVLLARVTTQSQNTPFDVTISDWKQAGLLAPSTVRLRKLPTLPPRASAGS